MTVSPPLDVSALPDPLGSVLLYAPTDWFDLLAGGHDEEAARARCADLINRSYPHKATGLRQTYTDALMAWRRVLLNQGVITHGVVAVPEGEYGRAVWQISAGVVEVPAANQDVDLGEVLARHFGQELRGGRCTPSPSPRRWGSVWGSSPSRNCSRPTGRNSSRNPRRPRRLWARATGPGRLAPSRSSDSPSAWPARPVAAVGSWSSAPAWRPNRCWRW